MKNLVYLLLLLIAVSCSKGDDTINNSDELLMAPPPNRITICHSGPSESAPWITLQIPEPVLQNHLSHGDILPDADGDGFTKVNPCGIGDQTDCDDEDPAINPDAEEICGDGIDNNCNGEIDEICCCFDDLLDQYEIRSVFTPATGAPVYRITFVNGPIVTLGAPPGVVGGGWVCQTNYVCHVCGPGSDNPAGCSFADYCDIESTPPISAAQYEYCSSVIASLASESGLPDPDAEIDWDTFE